MKRRLATISVAAALLAAVGVSPAQVQTQDRQGAGPAAKAGSDSLVPIPGTGTAEVKGNRLIGADVKNAANEKLGDVDEVLVTTDGRVNAIVVATGGLLGIGERKVVLPWERLRFSSQGSALVVMTDASRDSLKAMPEYSDPSRASSQQRVPAEAAPGSEAGNGAVIVPYGLDRSRPIRPVPKSD